MDTTGLLDAGGREADDEVVNVLVDAIVGMPPWLVVVLVFALPALEASAFVGLVVPGETAVLVGGVVAHGGGLPLWAVIVAGVAGAAVGDQIGYLVGRRYGDALLARVPARVRRSGELDRAIGLVRRRGAMAVVIGRWAAALRALVPGIAGMSGVPRTRFTVANMAGGALWAGAVAVLGFAAGASYRALEAQLNLGAEILLGVILVGAVGWVWWSRRRSPSAGDPG
ncbi:DedA family protein [Pseudonocardia hydrocarbonoxydans]|uniref:DedA family protein n=1 Tax=Pseudonocardia hydrocarbonoxydans TaxID=76726 RepID=UPI001FE56054|nr:DedA family protein [Pseudonocardia hydrocarbonoxydans]